MSAEEAVDLVDSLCQLLTAHRFDEAREMLERERDATRSSQLSHWHQLLAVCQLVVQAERQYCALALTSVRSFLRRDTSAVAGFETVLVECARHSGGAASRCAATAALQPVYQQLALVSRWRLWLMGWYDRLRTYQTRVASPAVAVGATAADGDAEGGRQQLLEQLMAQSRAHLHLTECCSSVCDDVDTCRSGGTDSPGERAPLPPLTASSSAEAGQWRRCVEPMRRAVLRETEFLVALLSAQRHMWHWRFTGSLLQLDRAHFLLRRLTNSAASDMTCCDSVPRPVTAATAAAPATLSGGEQRSLASFFRTSSKQHCHQQQQQQQQQSVALVRWLRSLLSHSVSVFSLLFRSTLHNQAALLSSVSCGSMSSGGGGGTAPVLPTHGDELYARIAAFRRRHKDFVLLVVIALVKPGQQQWHMLSGPSQHQGYVHPGRPHLSSLTAPLSYRSEPPASPQPVIVVSVAGGVAAADADLDLEHCHFDDQQDLGRSAAAGGGEREEVTSELNVSHVPRRMQSVWQQLADTLVDESGAAAANVVCRWREQSAASGGQGVRCLVHYVLSLGERLSLAVVTRGRRGECDPTVKAFMNEFRSSLYGVKLFLQLPTAR